MIFQHMRMARAMRAGEACGLPFLVRVAALGARRAARRLHCGRKLPPGALRARRLLDAGAEPALRALGAGRDVAGGDDTVRALPRRRLHDHLPTKPKNRPNGPHGRMTV